MTKGYFSKLTSEEKHILKDKGTEAPFTGEYNEHFEAGIFICRACENPLYESNTKFNSGCGWPSFDDEIEGAINRHEDLSGGRIRTEICCKKCDLFCDVLLFVQYFLRCSIDVGGFCAPGTSKSDRARKTVPGHHSNPQHH